ncbi:hypothetical protein V8G54_002197 [Vigna mungo]|uniref:Glycosyltransferase n=1 Tax=Vigna mungo TaxID=3915 RepID=A0AAQ3P8U1_VIGMU
MPLLNLALKLANAAPHCTFSFIGTHTSNAILFPRPHIPDNIKPYSISDGIPEGHVLSKDQTEKIDLFLKTETKKKVTCIISDAFVTYSLLVAQTLNVPWIALWLPNSCSLSLYFYTDLIRHHCGLSMMRVEDIPQDLKGEKESIFLRTLVSLGQVLPQVPLPSPVLPLSDKDSSGCLSWLDSNSARSVAYVCFGTVVAPAPHELVAVAEALEESGFPFLWSLKEGLMGGLPNGFVERTKMRGKVVAWTPQREVLAHDSIGVFLTHCGANSVIESVSSGVPMICRPFFGDQDIAGRVIEDIWESGIIIEGRVFTKNAVLKSLNLILVQEEGKKIRENALKAKKTVEDAVRPEGHAAKDFKTLVEIISTS